MGTLQHMCVYVHDLHSVFHWLHFLLLQSLFKSMLLKFWRSYEAMIVNKMWQTSLLLAFIWYVLVCMCVLLIIFVGSRVHKWTRKEDTSVACTDGLKSTQSMSSIFGLSLKNDTDLNLHLRDSFIAGFI